MQFPRCQATIRMADRSWENLKGDVGPHQIIDISIIAAIAVAIGLSGQLTAQVCYDDDLGMD